MTGSTAVMVHFQSTGGGYDTRAERATGPHRVVAWSAIEPSTACGWPDSAENEAGCHTVMNVAS
jgi:hypothetical protein